MRYMLLYVLALLIIGCKDDLFELSPKEKTNHYKFLDGGFECDGIIFTDNLGVTSSSYPSLKCTDGTIVRNIGNFIVTNLHEPNTCDQ